MSSRSLRIHHRNRLIQNTSKYMIVQYKTDRIKAAKLVYNNASVCSCMMCCNERHNEWNSKKMKLSMQERKAECAFLDYLREM